MKIKVALALGAWITAAGLVCAQDAAPKAPVAPPAPPAPGFTAPRRCCDLPPVYGVTPSAEWDAPCDCCLASGHSLGPCFWGSAEYLLWWFKDSPLPVPLVTIGPGGALGTAGTSVLLGGRALDTEEHSGGRFTIGAWLDDCKHLGVEASYFSLGERAIQQRVQSAGTPTSPILSIPFFDVTIPGESSAPLATFLPPPGFMPFSGTAILRVANRLDGAELNAVCNLTSGCHSRLDLLAGFRYLHLDEDLDFRTSSPNIIPPFDVFTTADEFSTSNNFFGGQLGVRAEASWGSLSVSAVGKIALGDVNETARIGGVTLTNQLIGGPIPLTRFPGGYFAEPSNSGRFHRSRFAVLPEANLNVGWQLTDLVRVFAGYSFLYLSDVARPGDLIDRRINMLQSVAFLGIPPLVPPPGPPAPVFRFRDTDFWAQGINVGLDIRY